MAKKRREWKAWMVAGSCGGIGGKAFLTRKEAKDSADRKKIPAAYWFLRDPIKVIRVRIVEE